jgi:hypothetical protein
VRAQVRVHEHTGYRPYTFLSHTRLLVDNANRGVATTNPYPGDGRREAGHCVATRAFDPGVGKTDRLAIAKGGVLDGEQRVATHKMASLELNSDHDRGVVHLEICCLVDPCLVGVNGECQVST